MVYELLDNFSYWSHLVIYRISRKPLNLDVEIILSLNRKYYIRYQMEFECLVIVVFKI